MGAGFLLFGYFFFCDLQIGIRETAVRFDVLPDFFGWLLLLVGCIFGARFSQKLGVAKHLCLVMLLPSLFSALHALGVWPYLFADEFYRLVYPFLEAVMEVLFHFYMLFGLRDICEELGDQKLLVVRLKGNFYLTLFCYAWIFAARAGLVFAPHLQTYCSLISSFSAMVYLLVNAFVLFKVFRNLTVE